MGCFVLVLSRQGFEQVAVAWEAKQLYKFKYLCRVPLEIEALSIVLAMSYFWNVTSFEKDEAMCNKPSF